MKRAATVRLLVLHIKPAATCQALVSMSRALLSMIIAWLLRVLKAMPSMGCALLRTLRSVLSLRPASSRRQHSESNAVRTICASSMPSPLKQREMSDVSPSHMHSSSKLTTDAGRGTDPATHPDNSMTGNLPAVSVQSVTDRHLAVPRRPSPVPASPQQVTKYRFSQRPLVSYKPGSNKMVLLKKGDMSYDRPSLPIGWIKYTQPEGAPYYLHEEKRIITDLTDVTELQQLLEMADFLLHSARELMLPLHLDVELVITEVLGSKGERVFGYYFVDHRQRLLFWVHDYDLLNIFFNVDGVTARDHMKQAVITQYWMHIELYPNRREVRVGDYEELRNILSCAIADAATSNAYLAHFELDSMTRMLDLVEKLERSVGKENPYAVWVIARFAREFSRSRFINFSGQPCARLGVDQCIYASPHHLSRSGSSFLIRIFDLFLFRSASRHLEELRQMWIDQIVHYRRWQKHIAKLTSEWARFTIFSTVLLTADVSLLATPALGSYGNGLGGGSGGTLTNGTGSSTSSGSSPPMALQVTAAMTSIYLSIFFSVASILASIQLTNHVGGKEYSSAASISALLQRTDKSLFGTDSLAIMYSLPYTFLVWSIFLFVLGMSFLVFSSTNHAMLATLAPFFSLLFVFSIWPSISRLGTYEMFEKLWRRKSLIRRRLVSVNNA
ncbi:hypothetical protein EV401DRAFT_1193922 [Pisolithus croceorrhizus]|nr:hypothetical protein EV401DRAFT_1193922 [Pisolithus croceorrhizus]